MINTAGPDGYKELIDGVFLKTIVHGRRTLMTGSLRFFGEGGETIVGPGDSWNFSAEFRYGAKALEDTVVIEVFSPVREDYLP